jgi:hypothetical protein
VRAHRDAVIAELQTRLPGAVFKSYSAAAKAPTVSRYAVVFIGRASKPRTRFTGGQWRDVYTVTVHSVGSDEDLALWVEERVVKLTGVKLTVSGRNVWPVEYITGQPPSLDDDGTKPLWFTVSQFDIMSDPA